MCEHFHFPFACIAKTFPTKYLNLLRVCIYIKMSSADSLFDEQFGQRDLRSRIRHTFSTGIMSDVNFVVGESTENQKRFAAHRYILGVNSPVFYAMFFGSLIEANSDVPIPDTDPESFEEFLRYLYTEECVISEDNVISIVYLSTKYIVPSLTKKCVRFLQKTIAPDTAFSVLSHAVHFGADGLEENCWDVIDSECHEALESDAFLNVDHALLCELLSRDTLNVKEIDLFHAALKWSQNKCTEQGLKGTDKDKQTVLGNAVNLIRFPTMTIEEFAADVVHRTKILTDQDVIEIFLALSGKKQSEQIVKFTCKPRRHPAGRHRCSRFTPQKIVRPSRTGKGWCYSNDTLDALCFRVSCAVTVHGVRVFGDEENGVYRLKVNLLHGNKELSSNAGEFRSEIDEDGLKPSGFDVLFPEAVKVTAGEVYTISGSVSGPRSLYGQGGEKTVMCDGVQFMFCSSDQSNNGTSVFHGQFPQIIFSKE